MSDVTVSKIKIDIDTTASMQNLRNLQNQISSFNQSVARSTQQAANQQARMNDVLTAGIESSGHFAVSVRNIETSTSRLSKAIDKGKLSLTEYFRYGMASSKQFASKFSAESDAITRVAEERVKRLQTHYIALGKSADGYTKSLAIKPLQLFNAEQAIATERLNIHRKLLRDGADSMVNFGKNTQWAGRQLMVGFTVPLTLFAQQAGKAFEQLDKARISFRRVYGDTMTNDAEKDQALKNVEELAKQYTKYGIAVADTIRLSAKVAATGLQGNDMLDATAASTRLATLGEMEYQQALDATISMQSAFGVSAKDLGQTIDFLNAVENQTVLSLQDIAEAIPRVAPAINSMGGDVKDLSVYLTAMREGGVDAVAGANALKTGIARIINPTKQAREELAKLGINITNIVESNAGDLDATMRGISEALKPLDNLNRSRALQTMFGTHQFVRMQALFDNLNREGSQAQRVMELTGKSAVELAALADQELAKIEEASSTRFANAVEKIKTAIAPIGEEFMKIAAPVIEWVSGVIENINKMPQPIKDLGKTLVVAFGAVLPLLTMVVGLAANGIGTFNKMRLGLVDFVKSAIVGKQEMQTFPESLLEANVAAQHLEGGVEKLTAKLNLQEVALKQLVAQYVNANQVINGVPLSKPRVVRGFNTGDIVPGIGDKDTVPAALTPGEFVVNKRQTKKHLPLLRLINSGGLHNYATGGLSGGIDASHIGSSRSSGAEALEAMGQTNKTARIYAVLARALDGNSKALQGNSKSVINAFHQLTILLPSNLQKAMSESAGGASRKQFAHQYDEVPNELKLFPVVQRASKAKNAKELQTEVLWSGNEGTAVRKAMESMAIEIKNQTLRIAQSDPTAGGKVFDRHLEEAGQLVIDHYKDEMSARGKVARSMARAQEIEAQYRVNVNNKFLNEMAKTGEVIKKAGMEYSFAIKEVLGPNGKKLRDELLLNAVDSQGNVLAQGSRVAVRRSGRAKWDFEKVERNGGLGTWGKLESMFRGIGGNAQLETLQANAAIKMRNQKEASKAGVDLINVTAASVTEGVKSGARQAAAKQAANVRTTTEAAAANIAGATRVPRTIGASRYVPRTIGASLYVPDQLRTFGAHKAVDSDVAKAQRSLTNTAYLLSSALGGITLALSGMGGQVGQVAAQLSTLFFALDGVVFALANFVPAKTMAGIREFGASIVAGAGGVRMLLLKLTPVIAALGLLAFAAIKIKEGYDATAAKVQSLGDAAVFSGDKIANIAQLGEGENVFDPSSIKFHGGFVGQDPETFKKQSEFVEKIRSEMATEIQSAKDATDEEVAQLFRSMYSKMFARGMSRDYASKVIGQIAEEAGKQNAFIPVKLGIQDIFDKDGKLQNVDKYVRGNIYPAVEKLNNAIKQLRTATDKANVVPGYVNGKIYDPSRAVKPGVVNDKTIAEATRYMNMEGRIIEFFGGAATNDVYKYNKAILEVAKQQNAFKMAVKSTVEELRVGYATGDVTLAQLREGIDKIVVDLTKVDQENGGLNVIKEQIANLYPPEMQAQISKISDVSVAIDILKSTASGFDMSEFINQLDESTVASDVLGRAIHDTQRRIDEIAALNKKRADNNKLIKDLEAKRDAITQREEDEKTNPYKARIEKIDYELSKLKVKEIEIDQSVPRQLQSAIQARFGQTPVRIFDMDDAKYQIDLWGEEIEDIQRGPLKAVEDRIASVEKGVQKLRNRQSEINAVIDGYRLKIEEINDRYEKMLRPLRDVENTHQGIIDKLNHELDLATRSIKMQLIGLENQRDVIEWNTNKRVEALDAEKKAFDDRNEAARKSADEQESAVEKQQKTFNKSNDKQQNAIEKRLKALSKQKDAYDKQYDGQVKPLRERLDLLDKERKAFDKARDAEQKIIDKRVEALREEKEAYDERQDAIVDGIEKERKAYDKATDLRIKAIDAIVGRNEDSKTIINDQIKAINDQVAALQKVQSINESIARQQESQLTLADALTSGDMSAAARAMQEAQRQAAQDASARQAEGFEAPRAALEARLDLIDRENKNLADRRQAIEDERAARNDAWQETLDRIADEREAYNKIYDAQQKADERRLKAIADQREAYNELYDSTREKLEAQLETLDKAREKFMDAYEANTEPLEAQLELLKEQREASDEAFEIRLEQIKAVQDKLAQEKELHDRNYDAAKAAAEAPLEAINKRIAALEHERQLIENGFDVRLEQERRIVEDQRLRIAALERQRDLETEVWEKKIKDYAPALRKLEAEIAAEEQKIKDLQEKQLVPLQEKIKNLEDQRTLLEDIVSDVEREVERQKDYIRDQQTRLGQEGDILKELQKQKEYEELIKELDASQLASINEQIKSLEEANKKLDEQIVKLAIIDALLLEKPVQKPWWEEAWDAFIGGIVKFFTVDIPGFFAEVDKIMQVSLPAVLGQAALAWQTNVVEPVEKFFENLGKAIDTIPTLFETAVTIVRTTWDGFWSGVQTNFDGLKKEFDDKVVKPIKDGIAAVKQKWDEFWGIVTGNAEGAKTTVGDKFAAGVIANGIVPIASKFAEFWNQNKKDGQTNAGDIGLAFGAMYSGQITPVQNGMKNFWPDSFKPAASKAISETGSSYKSMSREIVTPEHRSINQEWRQTNAVAKQAIDGIAEKWAVLGAIMSTTLGQVFNPDTWASMSKSAALAARQSVNELLTMFNAGPMDSFDKIAQKLHIVESGQWLPRTAPISPFARGGILPGFTPVSKGDDQLTMMRSGEGVTVSEALRGNSFETSRLLDLNKAALTGSMAKFYDKYGTPGYAKGGLIGDAGDISGNIAGLDPAFLRYLGLWNMQEAGSRYRVSVGFRSIAEQKRLYDLYISGQRKVRAAKPGQSWHQYGQAADLAPDTTAGHRNAANKYNLNFPMADEPWHVQLIDSLLSRNGIVNDPTSFFGDLAKSFSEEAPANTNHILAGVVANMLPEMGKAFAGAAEKIANDMFVTGVGTLEPDINGSGAKASNVASRWANTVIQALNVMGLSDPKLTPITLRRLDQESSGNPNAVNLWDANAKAGHPSVGLMQVIRETYQTYKHPAYDKGPYLYGVSTDPMSNILASMRYALARYGNLANAYNRPGGYARGGIIRDRGGILPTGSTMVHNMTGRPEWIFNGNQVQQLSDMISAFMAPSYNVPDSKLRMRGMTVNNSNDVYNEYNIEINGSNLSGEEIANEVLNKLSNMQNANVRGLSGRTRVPARSF